MGGSGGEGSGGSLGSGSLGGGIGGGALNVGGELTGAKVKAGLLAKCLQVIVVSVGLLVEGGAELVGLGGDEGGACGEGGFLLGGEICLGGCADG